MQTTTHNEVMKEARIALHNYAASGLVGFASKAYDRLKVCGVSMGVLGRIQEWTPEYGAALYRHLFEG